jgi:hypothetical protein
MYVMTNVSLRAQVDSSVNRIQVKSKRSLHYCKSQAPKSRPAIKPGHIVNSMGRAVVLTGLSAAEVLTDEVLKKLSSC